MTAIDDVVSFLGAALPCSHAYHVGHQVFFLISPSRSRTVLSRSPLEVPCSFQNYPEDMLLKTSEFPRPGSLRREFPEKDEG